MKQLSKNSIEKLRDVHSLCEDRQYVPSTENGRGTGFECSDCPYERRRETQYGFDSDCYWKEIFGDFPCNWKLSWLSEDGLKKWRKDIYGC